MLTHGILVANLWGMLEGYLSRDNDMGQNKKWKLPGFGFCFNQAIHRADAFTHSKMRNGAVLFLDITVVKSLDSRYLGRNLIRLSLVEFEQATLPTSACASPSL